MNKYTVIIIGGGPTGAMCGIELQKAGVSTCIIDRAVFPRDKLCGGLLTKKTLDLLGKSCQEIPPEEFVIDKTDSVKLYYRNEKVIEFTSRIPFYFTDRKILDHVLIKHYQKLGGTVYENTKISLEKIDNEFNTLKLNNESLRYEVLVGAYGCGNLFTRWISKDPRYTFCIEGKVGKDPTEKNIEIYFGLIRRGYGWNFPKKDHLAIGIGGENDKRNVRDVFNAFIREVTPKDVFSIHGAPVPSGRLVNFKKLRSNLLLVGDAAGFIDPITGEGIYYALLSGKVAADSILQATRAEDPHYRDIYLANIRKIRKNITYAYFLKAILYNSFVLKHFMHFIRKHHSFALFYIEEIVSQYKYGYKDFMWHYLRERFGRGKRWE